MLWTGYYLPLGFLEVLNSWGKSWGDNGRAWMPVSHLEKYDWDAWTVVDFNDPGGR